MDIKTTGAQLNAGTIYLNELHDLHGLGLGFWGHPLNGPAFVIRDGQGFVGFVQFQSREFADAWFKDHDQWSIVHDIEHSSEAVDPQPDRD